MQTRLYPLAQNPTVSYVVETEREKEGMFFYRYTVVGRGYFPCDMLRYDRSFPSGPEDAAGIGGYTHDAREVVLATFSRNPNWTPTFDRWRSFGWIVKTDV